MADKESSIINNDSALPIPRQFARWLGWNEAGILQQIHWHIQEGHGQVLAGVRWIRMSETEWMEEIPLDEKAIQRAISNLENDGLIMTAVFKGRCKWYTVIYDAVADLTGPVERITQKSEKRKRARAARLDIPVKEQNVPIVINPTVEDSNIDSYTKAKEQSVPIVTNDEVREQSVPTIGTKCTYEWEQNVPLQESSQESFKNPILILDAHAREILDKIGSLCRTNFFNPAKEPFKTSLLKTIQDYTAERVLWAIELALSPEKANGKPKTWGFVLAILEKDKDGSYRPQNGAMKSGQYSKQTKRTKPPVIPAKADQDILLRMDAAARAAADDPD